VLAGDRIDHVANHDQRAGLKEGIHDRSRRIGDQQHVAFVDRRPAANAGSVEAEAFFKRAFFQLGNGIGDVLLNAREVREAQVKLLGFVLLGELEDFFWSHSHSVSPGNKKRKGAGSPATRPSPVRAWLLSASVRRTLRKRSPPCPGAWTHSGSNPS